MHVLKWIRTSCSTFRKAGRNKENSKRLLGYATRRSHFESLEQRAMLSATATLDGQEFDLPSWLSAEEVTAAQESIAEITTTGDTTPIYSGTARVISINWRN
jgi:hypothetical protein